MRRINLYTHKKIITVIIIIVKIIMPMVIIKKKKVYYEKWLQHSHKQLKNEREPAKCIKIKRKMQ